MRPLIAVGYQSKMAPMSEDCTLGAACARAYVRWSARGVCTDRDAFVAYVEERAARVDEPWRARLHVDDLYLAFACGRLDAPALAVFEAELMPAARSVLARMNLTAVVGDDVIGELRERLFVPAGETAPLIAGYSGRGELRCWLRSLAAHAALKAMRGVRRFVTLEQADEIPVVDAELARLRGADAVAFRGALGAAFAGLTRAQRAVLRQHFLDGLTFEALGRLHGIHTSTAWRRVELARQALVAAARARLGEALDASESAVNRIVRSAYVEASVTSLLRLTPGSAPADG